MRDVRIVSPDGTVLREGESEHTVTVWAYSEDYDAAREGFVSPWEEHTVSF